VGKTVNPNNFRIAFLETSHQTTFASHHVGCPITPKTVSLTMDGSTDDSVTEQETVFLRTCMEGKIVNRFVCIGEPKRVTAVVLSNISFLAKLFFKTFISLKHLSDYRTVGLYSYGPKENNVSNANS
jgi:hypothetical protein